MILSLLVVALVLMIGGVAQAATSQDILNDYLADRDLDATYTDTELEQFLTDATVQTYANQNVLKDLNNLIKQILSARAEDTDGRGEFPFTGFEMLIAGLGAVALVGGGLGLRRKSSH